MSFARAIPLQVRVKRRKVSPALNCERGGLGSREACANPTGVVYGDFVTEIPAYFCSRGRNGFKGRLIEPEQVRLMVLPPSLQT
jgi:hypothetical protein